MGYRSLDAQSAVDYVKGINLFPQRAKLVSGEIGDGNLNLVFQIRDENNLIILPATMSKKGPVRYQMDTMGNVHRIWFLTPDEARQERGKEKNKK